MNTTVSNQLHTLMNDLYTVHVHLDQLALEPFNLTIIRYHVLQTIHNEPGLSFTRLSHVNLTDRASASRIVRSMEKDGLVERQLDEKDRRYYLLFLTEEGQVLYEAANKALQADIEARYAPLGDLDMLTFQSSLQQTFDTFIAHRDQLLAEKSSSDSS